jgi:hypothetical protein
MRITFEDSCFEQQRNLNSSAAAPVPLALIIPKAELPVRLDCRFSPPCRQATDAGRGDRVPAVRLSASPSARRTGEGGRRRTRLSLNRTRYLNSWLYEVTPTDPATVSTAPHSSSAVAGTASHLPARGRPHRCTAGEPAEG